MSNNVKKENELFFSKSSFDMLIKCPLQYHYSKDEHLSEEQYQLKDKSEWLESNEKGTFAHLILQKYVDAYLKGKKNNEIGSFDNESFEKIFDECVKEFERNYPIYSMGEAKIFQTESKKSLKQYLEELHEELKSKDNKWIIAETELNIEDCKHSINIDNFTFEVNYKGIIDRIDVCEENGKKIVRIIDYKTGSKDNFAKYANAENTSQHHIYKLLAEKNGYVVEEFDYVFIFDDDKKGVEKILRIEKNEFEDPISGSSYPRKISANPNDKIVPSSITPSKIIYNVFKKRDYMLDKLDEIKKEEDRCIFCNYKNICIKRMI